MSVLHPNNYIGFVNRVSTDAKKTTMKEQKHAGRKTRN